MTERFARISATEDDEETLSENWRFLGLDLAQVTLVDGTMKPAGWGSEVPATVELGDGLTVIQTGIDLKSVLGQGANGVVWLGDQRALRRSVAVKRLHADDPEADKHLWLLREARVNGALEHPNIVPVHDIVVDDGEPMIVMKRVEGRSWNAEIEEDREILDQEAFLARHLPILVQVARAAHYAHAQGVLHRDIKPENVMLGEYGEVYLVDWSVAVALDRCEIPGMLRVSDIKSIFGTPAYMAPEMAGCVAADHAPSTDVYLLGACLHELLDGKPPHGAEELVASLRRAWKSKRPVLEGAPLALAAVCRRALAREPSDRTPTAAIFARELDDFLQHRHALSLAEDAAKKLGQLEATERTTEDAEVAQTYRECRFLFERALGMWAGNEAAKQGLRAATTLVVQRELAAGRPEAAHAILAAANEGGYPDLKAEVEAARLARRADVDRLEEIAHDRDVSINTRDRGLGAALLSVSSVVIHLGCGAINRFWTSVQHLEYLGALVIYLAWAVLVIYALRARVLANKANRQLSGIAVLTIAAYIPVQLIGYLGGVAFHATLAFQMFVFVIIWIIGAAALDRRMAALPVVGIIEIPLLLLFPAWCFEILAGATGAGLVVTAFLLRARGQEG